MQTGDPAPCGKLNVRTELSMGSFSIQQVGN